MDIRKITHNEIYEMLKDEAFNEEVHKGISLKYFFPQYLHQDFLIGAFDKDKLCGLIQFGKNPHRKDNNTYAMKFVSVNPQYRNQGIAKKLLEAMIKDLVGKVDVLELSRYEDEGVVLINTVKELALKYPEITIMHRKRTDPHQNAMNHYIEVGMKVKVDDPTQNLIGIGEVVAFIEYSNPLKVYVKISDQVYEVDCKYLTPQ